MKIPDYLKKHGLTQEAFAKRLGVTQGAVHQWINGDIRITAERAVQIETETGGEIPRHEYRDDLFPEPPSGKHSASNDSAIVKRA